MADIIWAEPALLQLNDIAEYIALDKPQAAKAFVTQVFEKAERLKDHPKSGRIPPELGKSSRYRELIIPPCRVFYRLEGAQVFIVYIMRSERELKKFLLS